MKTITLTPIEDILKNCVNPRLLHEEHVRERWDQLLAAGFATFPQNSDLTVRLSHVTVTIQRKRTLAVSAEIHPSSYISTEEDGAGDARDGVSYHILSETLATIVKYGRVNLPQNAKIVRYRSPGLSLKWDFPVSTSCAEILQSVQDLLEVSFKAAERVLHAIADYAGAESQRRVGDKATPDHLPVDAEAAATSPEV